MKSDSKLGYREVRNASTSFNLILNSNDVPKTHRFEFWRSMFEKVGDLIPDPERTLQDCTVEGILRGPIGYARVCGPGFATHRRREHLQSASEETLSLVRYDNPVRYHFGNDLALGLKRGEILLNEGSATYEMSFPVAGRQKSRLMSIKRSVIDALLPHGLDYHLKPRVWSRSDKVNGLLATGIDLFNSTGAFDQSRSAGDRDADAFCALVAVALCPSPELLQAYRSYIDIVRLALAKQIIDKHIAEDGLDSARIAQLSGMSQRTLERVFEPVNGVWRYVQERRLELIYQALLRGDKGGLVPLAMAHGFVNRSHFSTAFKRRFGLAPRDVRALGGY